MHFARQPDHRLGPSHGPAGDHAQGPHLLRQGRRVGPHRQVPRHAGGRQVLHRLARRRLVRRVQDHRAVPELHGRDVLLKALLVPRRQGHCLRLRGQHRTRH